MMNFITSGALLTFWFVEIFFPFSRRRYDGVRLKMFLETWLDLSECCWGLWAFS